MFKLSIKKCYFLVKFCILFMSVMTGLSLFEFSCSGYCPFRVFFTDRLEEEYERQVLEDEARMVPGLGDGGAPVFLNGEDFRLGEESLNKNGMNTYLSDRISYTRNLSDLRHPACAGIKYDAELPSASVVIIFHNEPYSVLLRTVWSVLNTARRGQPWHEKANFVDRESGRTTKIGYPGQAPDSEHVYLREIILVDDHSTLPELRGKLSHYVRTRLPPGLVRLLRLPERGGLTRARQAGARAARGDVLVFLDGHCEGLQDWLRPLLQRVKAKRTAVATPVIDMIDTRTFEYINQGDSLYVGGFNFAGSFTWTETPGRARAAPASTSRTSPIQSPTMAGGLFAMSRAYYWELGGYDEQMAGWGGENLEMSFRVWQCGGSLELIPCAHVGHVFRSFTPYGLVDDSHGINTARVAEVWMDEYAELYYMHRPDLRDNPIVGDVTHRKILRAKLHCKSFQWFLDHVCKKFVPVRDALAFGRVRNPDTDLCLDTMRRRDRERAPLGVDDCRRRLTLMQHLSLSPIGQLRDEQKCALLRRIPKHDEKKPLTVLMERCDPRDEAQRWVHLRATHQLRHVKYQLCIDTRGAANGDDAQARPCSNHSSQHWEFDYDGTESSGRELPPSVEEQLRMLRGLRRDN